MSSKQAIIQDRQPDRQIDNQINIRQILPINHTDRLMDRYIDRLTETERQTRERYQILPISHTGWLIDRQMDRKTDKVIAIVAH